MYRICKSFEVESGHILYKHKEKCKNPHGHTRKIEIVLSCNNLDVNDMVCDFKVIKLAVGEFIDTFDHAILVNKDSPQFAFYKENYERVIGVEGMDPTTEVMAKLIFDHIEKEISLHKSYKSSAGVSYDFSKGLVLEKVRVWETSSTWAEFYK